MVVVIPAGQNFDTVIEELLAKCTVLLVVIGPGWLEAPSPSTGQTVFDEEDWARREIALRTGINVIPVFLDGATRLAAADLPRTLAAASDDHTVHLLDVTDPRHVVERPPLEGHTGQVTTLAYDPTSHWLASAGEDTTVRL